MTGGQLRIDDPDVRSVQLDSLRGAIGLVGQESFLFDGSVRENLLYAKPNATGSTCDYGHLVCKRLHVPPRLLISVFKPETC